MNANGSMSFNWKRAVLIGFGVITTGIIWPIFNSYVPIFLQAGHPLWEESLQATRHQGTHLVGFGLAPGLAFFIMTWDNILHAVLTPWIGASSDHTWTRFGRRKPWLLVGIPITLAGFLLIPLARTLPIIIAAIIIVNLGTAIYRAPIIAWLGDLFPPTQRSKASAVINVMRGVNAIAAFVLGGILFERFGRMSPFALGASILALSTLIAFVFVSEPKQLPMTHEPEGERQIGGTWLSIKNAWQSGNRDRRYVLLVVLFALMGFNALETGHSSFAVFELNVSPGRAALFAGVFALAYIGLSIPSGLLSEYIGRRRTIHVGLLLFTLTCLVGYLFIQESVGYLIVIGLCGVSAALIFINLLPLLLDTSNDQATGALTGLFVFIWQIASILGPVLVGYAIQFFASQRILLAFVSLSMMFAWLVMRKVSVEGPTTERQKRVALVT